jgi:hypothetical protein
LFGALALAFSAAACASAPDESMSDPPAGHSACSGLYWIYAGGSMLSMQIQARSDGAIDGEIRAPNVLDRITGWCHPTEPGQPAAVRFTRAGGAAQRFVGQYTIDVESGQITMEGDISQSGKAAAPFLALTLLDDSRVKIRAEAEALALRRELLQFLWKSDALPVNGALSAHHRDVPSPVPDLGRALAGVDELVIEMEEDFQSHVYHFRPALPANKLMIFHHGHAHDLGSVGGQRSIRFLLDRGIDVLGFYMPGYGPNTSPVGKHFQLLALDPVSRPYHPMKFFLEPVTIALNFLTARQAFSFVGMMGISGGGWTTTLYAAIDPRIQKSFPVAGSLPIHLRTGRRDIGDREQFEPTFFRIAGYPDLHALGAIGPGRRQIQILNEFDSCCFARSEAPAYVARAREAVSQIGAGGAYDLRIDVGQRQHTISEWTLEEVIGPEI